MEANKPISILIINPNTSAHMTDALRPIVEGLNYSDVKFDFFTAPSKPSVTSGGKEIQGIPSINCGEDSALSAIHCHPHLKPLLDSYDAFLVACYSAHPLVGMLKEDIKSSQVVCGRNRRKYVTGIFEASVSTCLSLSSHFDLASDGDLTRAANAASFGIVSTGDAWKDELSTAVAKMLLRPQANPAEVRLNVFAGVETTGLTAIQLHSTPAEVVREKMREATERLIRDAKSPVAAICLGCAGMSGMEEAVRQGCVNVLGPLDGENIMIVDGVVAGIGVLVNACKAGF